MKKIITLVSLFAITLISGANNITIGNLSMTGKNTTDHFVMVQFDISWENSWRASAAPNNWDAAWVFVKYRIPVLGGGDGLWKHCWFNNTGQTAPSGSAIDVGLLAPGSAFDASTNPGLGAFIYRSGDGTGTFTKAGVQLRWNYGANGLADGADVELQIYAIEMVYVPQGNFYVGSGGTETGSFTNGSWSSGNTIPLSLTSESALVVANTAGNLWYPPAGNSGDQSGPIPAAFPKGYNPFYCMKYEISQQEYVDFLNSLTYTQQALRTAGASPPSSSAGTGAFGNSYRNGINIMTPGTGATTPAVYACNLNGNTTYSEPDDGQWVACNYLSWNDVSAFLDWSGLRPATELEFEKACRGTLPPVANEYAWGTATITQNTGMTNPGANNETSSTVNANSTYNHATNVQGPMRVGAFATGASTRELAGSTYYGIMDMSGNLLERTVTVGNPKGRSFTGAHGNGALNVNGNADDPNWPGTDASGAGFRGFSWRDIQMNLQVSYRQEGGTTIPGRADIFGGRGVRTQPLSSVTTTAAISVTATTASSGGNVTSDGGATITSRGVCWSTSANPAITDSHTTDGSGTGSFTSNLTGLSGGTIYYVRAYASNIFGTTYGNEVILAPFICGSSTLTINHLAGTVAPVSKTVAYGTVTNIPGETSKCWITSNLGASQQATAVNDATEASAGWFWQFNRMQGYKNDGTVTPAWTITSISENSDWQAANDPCALELGSGWRIPTSTEWTNVDAAGNWTDRNGPWNSGLKMHAAGFLDAVNGSRGYHGAYGFYWSSAQNNDNNGLFLFFHSGGSLMDNFNKANGFPLRCLRDCAQNAPTSGTHVPEQVQITWNWNTVSGATGYKWNTTNDYNTATDIAAASTKTETGLVCNTSYTRYAWAYNTCSNSTPVTLTQSTTACPFICGTSTITINHAAGTVAPVTKTVSYGTVTNIPGETSKCWITRNLGASEQATSVSDATEASAGWYWQFNRKQGYKHDGTTLTPAWTITSISETSDWLAANDACAIELGAGWRIPTSTEWTNVDATGNWTDRNGPWNSGLKMHASGNLLDGNGSLLNRGSYGFFWSSTQDNSVFGWLLEFNSGSCYTVGDKKAYGFSLRCLRDCAPIAPTSGTHIPSLVQITWNWNTVAGATGYKWNTTNDYNTATDMEAASTKTETGLACNTLYTRYVWAYNTCSNSTPVTLTQSTTACPFTCGTSTITVNHVAGTTAPVTKTVTYGTVDNIPGETSKCWITRNLGASQQATAVSDATEASAGWHWQFNRKQGYKHDGTTRTPNSAWITSINENSDWVTGNDPCAIELGAGWRIPTSTEWTNVDAAGNWTDWNGPWNSGLKMHAAGFLEVNGSLGGRGMWGDYWSSTQNSSTNGRYLNFYSAHCKMFENSKVPGFSLRCLRSLLPAVTTSAVTSVTTNSASSGGNVTDAGTDPVTARGVCWSTSSNPTITGSYTTDGSGTGSYSSNLTLLAAGTTYYVRAYATNSSGTSYGNEVTFITGWDCGSSITINHVAGVVAPVAKTVNYGTVTNIPGETSKCWITRNLGASQQATAIDDATEASAGWYWQFNRKQGYKHDGTTLTTAWTITSISENSDWQAANDPCVLELGSGWRIPTSTEWTNVDAAGNWANWNGPWNSGLKMHAAGYLNDSDGSLGSRGSYGFYWSSTQDGAASGWNLLFSSGNCSMGNYYKVYGFSLRCLRD